MLNKYGPYNSSKMIILSRHLCYSSSCVIGMCGYSLFN